MLFHFEHRKDKWTPSIKLPTHVTIVPQRIGLLRNIKTKMQNIRVRHKYIFLQIKLTTEKLKLAHQNDHK